MGRVWSLMALALLVSCLLGAGSAGAQWCNAHIDGQLRPFRVDEDNYIAGSERHISEPDSVVSIQVYKSEAWGEDASWAHVCGGVLVNERWVLTAAHCARDAKEWPAVRVVACDSEATTDNRRNSYRIESRVVRFVEHPWSKSRQTAQQNDLALLRLDRNVSSSWVSPACVNRRLDETGAYRACVALGWGKATESGRFADRLQAVALDRISYSQCVRMYQNMPGVMIDGDRQMCAGRIGEHGKGICQGDTGGPLFCQRLYRSGHHEWELAGIAITGGRQCGSAQHPGLFMRVDTFLDWIEQTTGDKRIRQHGSPDDDHSTTTYRYNI